jgi:hypothetical protein
MIKTITGKNKTEGQRKAKRHATHMNQQRERASPSHGRNKQATLDPSRHFLFSYAFPHLGPCRYFLRGFLTHQSLPTSAPIHWKLIRSGSQLFIKVSTLHTLVTYPANSTTSSSHT